jgi:molybdopterin converting factor small subunit
MTKTIVIQYFALLREQRGCGQESMTTTADTPLALYRELRNCHHFTLDTDHLRVAVNQEFSTWDRKLENNDTIVFIPPVAGG